MESSYSIIIPIYNEECSIPELLNELKIFSKFHEILIINDGSNDQSRYLLSSYAYIRLINIPKKSGKGNAIRIGIKSAKFEKIVIYDGDLELKTKDISKFMILSKRINFVVGTRYKDIKPFKSLWSFGNFILTNIFNLVNGTNINDALCCAKSFHKKSINIKNLKSTGFDIDVELTSILMTRFKEFKTINLSYKRRNKSQGKKLNYLDSFRILNRILFSANY